MNSIGKLVPGRNAKINLALDLALLAIAIVLAQSRGFRLESVTGMPGMFFAAMCAWMLSTSALRHYSAWSLDRAVLDDAALTAVSVGAVATAVAALKLMGMGATLDVMKLITFLAPATIVLR